MKGMLILVLIAFSYCAQLRAQTSCAKLFAPCHMFQTCCEDLRCKDYRCAIKGTEDNLLSWAPNGIKCDWFHHCGKGFKCTDNRCIPDLTK